MSLLDWHGIVSLFCGHLPLTNKLYLLYPLLKTLDWPKIPVVIETNTGHVNARVSHSSHSHTHRVAGYNRRNCLSPRVTPWVPALSRNTSPFIHIHLYTHAVADTWSRSTTNMICKCICLYVDYFLREVYKYTNSWHQGNQT